MGAKKEMESRKRSAKKRDSGDALRLGEERFNSLLDLSSEWYWEQDENYRFTLITGARFGKTGIDPQQYLGTMRWDHGAVPVGDNGSWEKHKALLKARQPFADFVIRRGDSDGEFRYLSTSGQPVFDEKKRFRGYRGIARDVTTSMRAEQLLRLEHLVARCLADANNASAALKAVIRAVCETQGWQCGRYFRVDNEAGVLRFAESWSVLDAAVERFIEGSRDMVFAPGVGLTGGVWQSGQPLWVADLSKDGRVYYKGLHRDASTHGAFVFPVVLEGKTVGVLSFNSREVRKPDDRLLHAVRVIGSQIGQLLQRKQTEEEQRLFRLALDNSADMILLIDRKTMRYVDVNQAACRLLGYSREELLKMDPQDLLPESQAEIAQAHDELIANPSSPSGMRSYFRCKDGSTIPFESVRHVLRSGGNYIIAAICRDIRERLAAEEAQQQQVALIAQSAEKDRLLRLFYDLPFVGLAVTSPTSKRWLQVNDRMCEMLGYSREEMMDLAWTEITHPDDIAANLALFKRLAAGEFDAFQFDKRFLRKDGGIVDTTMECKCVRRGDGSLETVIIMVQDITERKRSEAALRNSAEQLRVFTDNVPAMTVSYDENLRCRFVNRRYSDFFGFGATEIVGKHLREVVGEDAYSAIKDHFAQVLRGHPVTYHRTHKRPNGESRYLEITVLPHIGDHGKFLGCFAVAADITEHKQTEERIQRIAHHDSLTGLPNRLLFNDQLNQAISLAKRGSRQFALLYLDLDKFKPVNDTLGHTAGDDLLKGVAARIRQQVRESDIVARVGGDEFTVILLDIARREDAETAAKKILAALATPFQLGSQQQSVDVGTSIGIAVYPADARDADALVKAADAAMYSAKQAGNSFRFCAA